MGNVSDVGLCQEVAAWQRKNQLSRDPQNGFVQARPTGPAYLQNEQMLEWRPTKAAPSTWSPGPPRAGTQAGSSRNRASSMFVTPTREMLGPDWHDQSKFPGSQGPSMGGSRPPDYHGRGRPESFGQRGRGPSRQSSAGPGWRPGPGPVRQCSAPVRRSGGGPSRQSSARSNLPVHLEEGYGGTAPPYDQEYFAGGESPRLRGALPQRPRTPRGGASTTSIRSRLSEEAPPWDAHPPISEHPPGLGSWGPEEEGPQRKSRAAPDRDKSPPRIQDTSIGKHLSEFLKRGVAQATPKKEEEERQAQIEITNGVPFIATIQKGFEGIFGHLATSKEEVLKKRGPMPAPDYEAVPGDDIDLRVQYYARQLPAHIGDCLKLYRISKGEYQIGSDEVHLAWQSKVNPPNMQNPNGSIVKEVFVYSTSKENVDGPNHEGKEIPCEPLPLYLRHTAFFAYDLQYGSKVMKVPQSSRLSFAEETGTLLKDGDADAKFNAMALATQQAKKREQAAMEWRKRNPEGMASSAPSRESAQGSSFGEPKASEVAREAGERPARAPPSPSKERPAPPPAAPEAAMPPPLGSRPIPGLDPPQLKMPPPPGPLQVPWGQPDARKAPVLQPPLLLNGPQGRPQLRMAPPFAG